MHHRGTSAVLAAAVGLSSLTLAIAAPAGAAPVFDHSIVKVNEAFSKGASDDVDWIEVINTSATETADVSGWFLRDNDTSHTPLTVPADTVLAPGATFSMDVDVSGGFGLGTNDGAYLYDTYSSASTNHVVDHVDWTTQASTTYARCATADGSYQFVASVARTENAANDCPTPAAVTSAVAGDVRINEADADGTGADPDWVELVNNGTVTRDLGGWHLTDSKGLSEDDVVVQAGSQLAPQQLLAVTVDVSGTPKPFGLGGDGKADNATLFLADAATQVDTVGWAPSGADFTWTTGKTIGRCPDGTGAFGYTFGPSRAAANVCTDPGPGDPGDATGVPSDVKLNEVASDPTDFFELVNTGTDPVDLDGWTYVDDDPSHTPVAIASTSTLLEPGALRSVTSTLGLGKGDTITVADDTGTQVFTFTWPSNTHAAPSYARCPDGTGSFQLVLGTVASAGTANDSGCPATASVKAFETESVFLNEVYMNNAGALSTHPDFVEVTNIGATAVDLSGWGVRDNKPATTDWRPFPSGTLVPAGGRAALEIDADPNGFGLGGDQGDDAHLLLSDQATEVDGISWINDGTGDGTAGHPLAWPSVGSLGRCPDDGTTRGTWQGNNTVTFGAANDCTLYTGNSPGYDPDDGALPWPGSASVTTSDSADTFYLPADGDLEETFGDTSGAVFDPADPGVLWVAKNKRGTLWKLDKQSDGTWAPATGWEHGRDPRFVDGTGHPDTEGLTFGPDGFVYMTSERNNDESHVNQNVVLKIDQDADDLTATQQWDLTAQLPDVTANLGLEGITWVPDSYLVAGGLQDQGTHAAYAPATYPTHGTGLFLVAFEGDGNIYAFALGSDGSAHKVATIASGFPAVMDVQFDPERQSVWALCDDTCQGRYAELTPAAGSLGVAHLYARPTGMGNLNNEGMAIAPRSTCVGGSKEVVWTDDGNTDHHSLRSGTIPCQSTTTPPVTQPVTVTFTSTAPAPVVGQTYAPAATGGPSGSPVTFAVAGTACSISSGTVTFTHVGSCTVTAQQAAAPGYQAGSATQAITVGKTATSLATFVGTGGVVTAKISVTAPGAGSPTGDVTFTSGGATLGTAALSNGVATLATPLAATATSVSAAYAGSADFLASQGTAARPLPTITTSVSPAPNKLGWRRGPVTVTFTCTGDAAPIDCPAPVRLSDDGTDLSASGVARAADGGTATVRVDGIRIDSADPVVRVGGVRRSGTYLGTSPDARCKASDALSGVDSCRLTTHRVGERVTVTATATDEAGNVARSSVSYTSPLVALLGATERGNLWVVRSGDRYTLVALSASRTAPSLLGPTRGRLEGPGKAMEAAGMVDELHRYTITVRLTLPKRGIYKLGIESGRTMHVVKVRR